MPTYTLRHFHVHSLTGYPFQVLVAPRAPASLNFLMLLHQGLSPAVIGDSSGGVDICGLAKHTWEKDWNRRLIFSLLMPMPVSLTEKCTSTSCPAALCTASATAACAVEFAA